MWSYSVNKCTYIILPRTELYLSIFLYDLIYSFTQLTTHLSHLRQTDPLLFLYPEQTVPGGEAGHDIRPLQSWLVQGSISMGSLSSPSSLKSLQWQIADRGNGWVSFQRAASTCLIIQGHIEQINKTTLMYGEVDNMCVSGGLHRHTPAQGQTQCFISVPKSHTRCQWNAARGFV